MLTIVNAGKRQVQVRVFNGNDNVCLTDINNYSLNGEEHRILMRGPSEDNAYRIGASYYWSHSEFISKGLKSLDHTSLTGKLPKGHIICLFDTGADIPNIADYTHLLNDMRGQVDKFKVGSEELNTVLESFNVVIPAIATSLSALGPLGALPAGVFAALAGVISIFMGDVAHGTEPTATPPMIKEIEYVVENVVEEESYRSVARDATVVIKDATNWLTRCTNRFESGNDLGAHFIEVDFKRNLEDYVSQSSALRRAIETFKEYPDIAKYTLPIYVVGAWTWLMILRLHDAVRLLEGDPIQLDDVEEYRDEIESLIKGLNAAKTKLQSFCDNKVKQSKVEPESIFGVILSQTLMTKYTGVDTTSQYQVNFLPPLKGGTRLENPFLFLDECVGHLNNHKMFIEKDISNLTSNPNAELEEYLSTSWKNKAKQLAP
jgi:hypothetical protein